MASWIYLISSSLFPLKAASEARFSQFSTLEGSISATLNKYCFLLGLKSPNLLAIAIWRTAEFGNLVINFAYSFSACSGLENPAKYCSRSEERRVGKGYDYL